MISSHALLDVNDIDMKDIFLNDTLHSSINLLHPSKNIYDHINQASQWLNINQSPERSYMRDRVDARNEGCVNKWLFDHQVELSSSEHKRLNTRLRAESIFAASQKELEELRRELVTSHSRCSSSGNTIQQPFAFADIPRCDNAEVKVQFTMKCNTPSTEPMKPINSVAQQESDFIMLTEAVRVRDKIIHRLKQQILRSDRVFFDAPNKNIKNEKENVVEYHNNRIGALDTQIQRLSSPQTMSSSEQLSMTSKKELQEKIQEMEVYFNDQLESIKRRTSAALLEHHKKTELRVKGVIDTAQSAVQEAISVFATERMEALSISQSMVMDAVSKEQGIILRESEHEIYDSLTRLLTEKLLANLRNELRLQLQMNLIPSVQQYLAGEMQGRLFNALMCDVQAVLLEYTKIMDQNIKIELDKVELSAINLSGKRDDNELNEINKIVNEFVFEFEKIKSTASKATEEQQHDHVKFISKMQLLEKQNEFLKSKIELHSRHQEAHKELSIH
eukprot:Tbor_TRINITY_DN5306_c1_g1::TRINITY_DN5306_c1_g1_i1::g.4350::m.4350